MFNLESASENTFGYTAGDSVKEKQVLPFERED
jgi:hypothetical protein